MALCLWCAVRCRARCRVQFWKFAITGADNDQEIKIWACESWTCLQTLRFLPNFSLSPGFVDSRPPFPCIKARLDLSANHLILTDINRKVRRRYGNVAATQ